LRSEGLEDERRYHSDHHLWGIGRANDEEHPSGWRCCPSLGTSLSHSRPTIAGVHVEKRRNRRAGLPH
jgi:hypothetical protein